MSDSIKWSEVNAGKYSMFDVELGEIKTTISCDNENSKKLISLLKELQHTHLTINEENEKLKKQIESSILLSEAEKSTLALMRKQIDSLLNKTEKSVVVSNIIEAHGGMKKNEELCKKGYQQQEIAKKWNISSARISMYIHEHGKSWQDLK